MFDVEEDYGLAIGNLTSQLFANFFMTPLDYYIKNELQFKCYGRYVDDFILCCEDKERLKKAIKQINVFCKIKLSLTLHPHKVYLQEVNHGVNFIGATIKPGRTYIGNRTVGQFYKKLLTIYKEPNKKLIDRFVQVVNSYFGLMKHHSSYNIRKKLVKQINERWLKYIEINKEILVVKKKKELS